MLPQLDLIKRISSFSSFTAAEIDYIVKRFHWRYKRYTIKKNSGGRRTILHPAKELKAIQYSIHESLLRQLPVHTIATAYVPHLKSPLRVTALRHSSYNYTVRLDFQDFFPSLRPVDLFRQLSKCYEISKEEEKLLTQSLFFHVKQTNQYLLPVGAPTSPTISNVSMYELDEMISALAEKTDSASAISRYADDIHFSSNIKGKCLEFCNALAVLLTATKAPSLSINHQKTLYLSKGTKRIVTGLYITPCGGVSIGREKKMMIKSLIYRHSKGLLCGDEISIVRGLLSFARDCEPLFLDRLAIKYGEHYYSLLGSK